MGKLGMLITLAALAASAGASAQATATAADPHASHHTDDAQAAGGYTEGEVRKVDKDAGKITLKHGAIANLGMPPMSMVFRAKDPAMLDLVKPGEKVRFKADRVEGALTVTEIEPVH